ncbi:MAG: hypothetical protein ACK5ZJ_00230, partial [Acidobacteriota bacterium]
MAIRLQISPNSFLARIFISPIGRAFLAGTGFLLVSGLLVFGYLYSKYSREIDEKLAVGPFRNASRIYAA